ncbi:MAG: TolC family protein, partial [Candidatus Bipolaricaulota bacterium]|nr:TolC family protein [Candidatus Bipolaricaulota bacterium]
QRQVTLEALHSAMQLSVLQESVEIAQTRVRSKQEQLAELRGRVERGQALPLDLLAAQIELRQSELALTKLQHDFALSQERFAHTFGLEKEL